MNRYNEFEIKKVSCKKCGTLIRGEAYCSGITFWITCKSCVTQQKREQSENRKLKNHGRLVFTKQVKQYRNGRIVTIQPRYARYLKFYVNN